MMSREALTHLMAAAESEGIRFISDEIYHGLDYAFPAVTAAELSPHALVINSFSKYFCMTGWRVGWMVVPEQLVRPIERLQQNLSISVPTLSQIAAEAAFAGRDEMEIVKHGYEANRHILIAGLPPFAVQVATCMSLKAQWEKLGGGMARVRKYDSRKQGLDYTLKCLQITDGGANLYEVGKFSHSADEVMLSNSIRHPENLNRVSDTLVTA